jgi:hypothetical protein
MAHHAQYTKWQQMPKHGRMPYGALDTKYDLLVTHWTLPPSKLLSASRKSIFLLLFKVGSQVVFHLGVVHLYGDWTNKQYSYKFFPKRINILTKWYLIIKAKKIHHIW